MTRSTQCFFWGVATGLPVFPILALVTVFRIRAPQAYIDEIDGCHRYVAEAAPGSDSLVVGATLGALFPPMFATWLIARALIYS